MTLLSKRITAGVMVGVAAAGLIIVLGAAGAKSTRHVKTVALLSLARGSFEVSLGDPPQWLPLADTPQGLTLLAGAPSRRGVSGENAYVGFVSARASCAATPAASRAPYATLRHFFSAAHSGAHAGMFAPNGGAAKASFVASVARVEVRQHGSARACIWVAKDAGSGARASSPAGSGGSASTHGKAPRSLVHSLVLPLLNRTFAASVSNLAGATAGDGGFTMNAIDGGHPFDYSVSTVQCRLRSTDRPSSVAAGTPASESISLSASPCPSDASTFSFRGADVNRRLSFPIADATTSPPLALKLGGCELDPLTGVTLAAAQQYLIADGCKLGQVEVSPYQRSLVRGAVAWSSVDGGVAELAPAGTTVDLVLNGNPA